VFVPRKSFNEGLKTINEFVNPFIEQTLRLSDEELASKTKSESGYTFLHELACFTRDRKVLRDQLVAVLLAGRDTTASTLSWTFYELARHPEVVQKLREEILETVGMTRAPTYKDLKSMKYLQVSHLLSKSKKIKNLPVLQRRDLPCQTQNLTKCRTLCLKPFASTRWSLSTYDLP